MINMIEPVPSFPYAVIVLDSYFVEPLCWDEALTFRAGFLHQIVACELRPVLIILRCFEKVANCVEFSVWPGLLFRR